jgi:hypothetical protein
MAVSRTPTTLGNLEFTDIKKSLTDYLRNQSIFSGYNFEGSALRTMIDLMAYNTYFYAYYANIINAEAFLDSAQRESSVISLVKPLGYTVPARTAAIATVSVAGLGASITSLAEGTQFTSKNSDGVQFSLFTLEDIPVIDGSASSFNIYEASAYIDAEVFPDFDFDNQKIVFVTDSFDLSTIRVITVEDEIEYVWTKVDSIGYASQVDERIYFIERTPNGFAVVFGSVNSLGKAIGEDTSSIRVRYLETNGVSGNGLINFTLPGAIVITVSQASGGKNNPDLDSVRFLAPKWFSAQERAVTPNDYKALLLEAGFFTDETKFNVFGGQDLSPSRFGRVFIASNESLTEEEIAEMINFLKERSVITVLPEYIESNSINIYTDFNFKISSTTSNRSSVLSGIRSLFNSEFAVQNSYNIFFSASDFITRAQEEYENELIISTDDFEIYLQEDINAGREYTFNLENEFYLPLFTPTDISEPFDLDVNTFGAQPAGTKGVFKIYAQTTSAKNTRIALQLWTQNETTGTEQQLTGDFGYFIASKGVLNIKSGIISPGTSARLKIYFRYKTFRSGLNNLTSFNANNITLL